MGLFDKHETIIIDATQYLRYVGGGYDEKPIKIFVTVPAGSSLSPDRIEKAGLQKLLAYAGRRHPISGVMTATEPISGRTSNVRFTYKPPKESFAVPAGYQQAVGVSGTDRASAAGKKALAVLKAIDKGFDSFMGGGTKKKSSSSHRKSSGGTKRKTTGTRKASGTRKTTSAGTKRKSSTNSRTRKSCGTKRKTTARRRS